MRRAAAALAVSLLLAACGGGDGDGDRAVTATTEATTTAPDRGDGSTTVPAAADEQEPIATVAEREISGIASSQRRPGIVWALPDSGEGIRNVLYGYRLSGGDGGARLELVETHEVRGQRNGDWEDLSIDGDTLWIGDVGNNSCTRSPVRLLAVREPEGGDGAVEAVEHPIRWDDAREGCSARDVEGIFVLDGMPYLVTKQVRSAVYRPAALTPGQEQPLVRVAEVPPPRNDVLKLPTGAALSPDGTRLLVTTAAFHWHLYRAGHDAGLRGDDRVRSLLASPPVATRAYRPGVQNVQVESATFLRGEGRALLAAETGEFFLVGVNG